MKISVVGCGAVGSYYGAMLCRAGHEVHFLLRSDYVAVRERGVEVRSVAGDFSVRPFAAARPEEIGVSDLVLIGLKTTANHCFSQLLPPLVGPQTRIVTLQNGLGNEAALAAIFTPQQILGGLCFVCLNRLAPGIIHHLDHGLVVLGEFCGPPGPSSLGLTQAFVDAGVPCKVTDDLARAHWEKLVWNIPFNGLGVAAAEGGTALSSNGAPLDPPLGKTWTTDQLLANPWWEARVRELMLEVIRVSTALGKPIPEALAEQMIARTRTMGPYRASTLLDFECGRPLELHSLFLEPLRQAFTTGVPVPRLEALCRVLTALATRCKPAGPQI
jgi:2-dehydropantoate 2-reductase